MKSAYRVALMVVIIAAGCYAAVINILNGALGLTMPYLRGFYGENVLLVSAWGLATGHGLYNLSALKTVPIITSGYAPMFYLFIAAGIKIWGISYIPGRTLAMLAMLGCAGMTAAIAKRRGSGMAEAILGGTLFLGAAPVFSWSGLMRVDFLAVFFELAAIFVLSGRNPSLRRSIIFIVLGVAAGYTKQSAFGLIVGSLIGMFLSGDKSEKKRAVFIGAGYALSAIVVFLIVEAATSGGFHKFVIGSVNMETSWSDFSARLVAAVSDPASLILIFLGILGAKRDARPLRAFPVIVVPFIIAFRFLGIRGGAFNYFIEPLAACSIWSALYLTNERKISGEKGKADGALVLAAVLCFILSGAYLYRNNMADLLGNVKNYGLISRPADVVSFMKRLPIGSQVLADYSDLPLFADCVPVMSDPFMLTLMVRDGKWNPAPVLDAVKSKRVKLVLTKERITTEKPMNSLPESVAVAVNENYRLIAKYGAMWVYVPK